MADIWARLQEASLFAGLRTRDRPGRIGVSVWGPAPVCDDIHRRLAAELGTEVKHPKTLARVYGNGPGFGLDACDPDSYAQKQVRRVWPSMDVKLIDSRHLTRSGLQRPTFALTLEGVPKDWEQSILRENDARLRPESMGQMCDPAGCRAKEACGPRCTASTWPPAGGGGPQPATGITGTMKSAPERRGGVRGQGHEQ